MARTGESIPLHFNPLNRLRLYGTIFNWSVLIIGAITLVGWQFEIDALKRPDPDQAAMNPTTALCFILSASSFLLIFPLRNTRVNRIGYFLAWALLAIVITRLVGFINTSFQIDLIIMANKLKGENFIRLSRMAPNTTFCFLLTSVIVMLLHKKRNIVLAQCMALFSGIISIFSILGYAYGVREFYGILVYLPMSLYTALCFFLFALSVLFHTSDKKLMKGLVMPYLGGLLGRNLIPLALLIPFLLGLIFMLLHRQFNMTVELGIASFTLSVMIAFVVIISYMVYSLNEKDRLEKLAEKKISIAYTLLQSSIESFKDVLIFSIDKEYRFLNFNEAFRQATKMAYGTSISKGSSMLECITLEKDRLKAMQNCNQALVGESHITIEVYGDVKPAYFETRYNPILDESNKIVGVTVLSEDITQRKESEDEIKELNKELESFSYSIAHDLKAPLRSISGYAHILTEDYHNKLDKEGQGILGIISKGANRMDLLIEGLLNFSKLGRKTISKSNFSPEQLIHSILEEQLRTVDKSRVKVNIGELLELLGDQALLYHVFQNLISNAVKYSMKKEEIAIEIFSTRAGNDVIYTIRDQGDGFDMRFADQLFNVFHRLHKSSEFEGTGIGLAISKKIIARHGGKIWAHAEVGKGAEFSFSLPHNSN